MRPGSLQLNTRQKIALARAAQAPVLAVRSASGRGHVTTVRRRGVAWRLDLTEGIDFSIWLTGAFEASTVAAYRSVVGPGALVVDVGANIGAHALPLARLVGPSGCVLAVEPTGHAFVRLEANLAANPDLASRVTTRQAMVVAGEDAVLPSTVMSSWPLRPTPEVHGTMRGRGMSTEGAAAVTLDRLVAEWGVAQVDPAQVDLVKIDVDGYECAVLDGAGETLGRHRPVVVCELAPHALAAKGSSLDELTGRFDACGYELRALRTRRPLEAADLARLVDHDLSINALALPR